MKTTERNFKADVITNRLGDGLIGDKFEIIL